MKTLEQLIKNLKLDWVNPNITEENFPIQENDNEPKEYKLYHFDHLISSDDAIKEMEKDGYRPGTLAELLVLGETQPELQKQFLMIALGSVWRSSDINRNVPGLHWLGSESRLDLLRFEGDWIGDYRFLAVRKSLGKLDSQTLDSLTLRIEKLEETVGKLAGVIKI